MARVNHRIKVNNQWLNKEGSRIVAANQRNNNTYNGSVRRYEGGGNYENINRYANLNFDFHDVSRLYSDDCEIVL